MDRKISWGGRDYAWRDHTGGGYVLDMIHIAAKVAMPEPVALPPPELETERPSKLQSPDAYWLVTLTLITLPGRVVDILLPDNFSTPEAAMAVAEKHLLSERQRAHDLFRIPPDPVVEPDLGLPPPETAEEPVPTVDPTTLPE